MIEMGIYSDNEKWDEIKTIKMTTTKNNEIKNDNTSKKKLRYDASDKCTQSKHISSIIFFNK